MSQTDLESVLEIYRRLGARLVELSERSEARAPSDADVAVGALEFLRLERAALLESGAEFDDPDMELTDQWRRRTQERVDAARQAIEAVQEPDERSYLLYILVEAILDLSSARRAFLFEESVDALFSQIDGPDRESAAYLYATFLTRRLTRLPFEEIEKTRAKIAELCDELEDQAEYEDVMGRMALGTKIGLDRLEPDDASQDAVDDLHSRTVVDFSALETESGTLRFYCRTLVELLDEIPDAVLAPALRENYAGLKALLTGMEESVATGRRSKLGRPGPDFDGENEPLEEDELDELRALLTDVTVDLPSAVEDGEFLRAFVERTRAFGVVETVLGRIREALETCGADPDDPAFARRRLMYEKERAFYEAERDAWFAPAAQEAGRSPSDYQGTASKLAAIARLRFAFGNEEEGKNAVREALALAPKLTDRAAAARIYKELAEINAAFGKFKAARKLADAFLAEVEKFDDSVMVDFAIGDAFPLLIRLFDREKLDGALELVTSPRVRQIWSLAIEFESAARQYLNGGDGAAFREAAAKVADDAIDATRDDDPVVAAAALKDFANYIQRRFNELTRA